MLRSMNRGHIKSAIASVKSSKWRSLLTMSGIIIGIVSVVTVVSIGEGIKVQVASQINQYSKNLITIRPGQIVNRDKDGRISGVNLFAGAASVGSLSMDDVSTATNTKGVRIAVPLSVVSGPVRHDNKAYQSVTTIATTSDLPRVLNQKVAYGDFFSSDDQNQNGAIIGANVAEEVFGQEVPLGRAFTLHDQNFIVRGIFEPFKTAPLSLDTDFNNAVFIPYDVAQELTKKNSAIYEILVQTDKAAQPDEVASALEANIRAAHGNQDDFTVLKQNENLTVTNNILDLLTRLIAGVAAISLLVGGVGIMNVMLVSVSERMHEIGIRKAIGATSRQIRNQFMIEATVLSVTGGVIGVILSLIINLLLRLFTDLAPIISWQVVAIAVIVSLAVGIVFGTAPALKAARKDPIDALRNV